ncbi:DUF7736 domain-containing protein [Streptosporangium saharense]|uniref:DUF7736 domain-containing protein n=1 Tax=Streptosporangium saharense TaxID=1706840 RepID=A0A7W7QGY3_9ACTN|nr:hypothetical protein [Streptosporangium saharense]MBB4913329.1 hypothetical protein [Streptosporangium saharense]
MSESDSAPQVRAFTLAEILSVTTGCRLVRTVGDMGTMLCFMAGETLWSHQLGRVAAESAGPILEQHPQLREVKIPSWIEQATQEEIDTWVAGLARRYGDTLPLTPLAKADHTSIDPVDEVRMIKKQAQRKPDDQ